MTRYNYRSRYMRYEQPKDDASEWPVALAIMIVVFVPMFIF